MKRKLLIILPAALIVIIAVVCGLIFVLHPAPFRLDDQYYGEASLETISADHLQRLVDEKSSFAVFVSQPACRASDNFEKVLQSFVAEHPMKFYEIAFSDLENLPFVAGVRFYPSFLIFKKGKLVDFLEADNDDHAAAYMKKIREKTKMTSELFSVYRERLKRKGVLDTSKYGEVSFILPRFAEFVMTRMI